MSSRHSKGPARDARPPKRPTAKQKQVARQKVRRQRQVQALGLGFKERFMSGCIAVGIVGFIMLVAFLSWTCLVKPD